MPKLGVTHDEQLEVQRPERAAIVRDDGEDRQQLPGCLLYTSDAADD